jgi:hypothetical protein
MVINPALTTAHGETRGRGLDEVGPVLPSPHLKKTNDCNFCSVLKKQRFPPLPCGCVTHSGRPINAPAAFIHPCQRW